MLSHTRCNCVCRIGDMNTGIHYVYFRPVKCSCVGRSDTSALPRVAPLTSMEKQCESQWRTSTGRPDWERVGESLRVSGILLRAYIVQLFLTAHPLLIMKPPLPGPLRKHVWILFLLTHGQIQTESKNDSIEALHPQPPPRWKKNERGGCSAEKVGTRQWHGIQRAGSGPAPISETLKRLLKKQHRAGRPGHIFVVPGGFNKVSLAWLKDSSGLQ